MKQKEDSLGLFEEGTKGGDATSSGGRVAEVLDGKILTPPPIWLMRQAGRYLPEYRAVRAKAGGFLDLCFDPQRASEVTLQPVRRFDFDAAILFSDILVIPHALGRRVWFVMGEGPRLDPIDVDGIAALEREGVTRRLAPVLETVAKVRAQLSTEKTLLGFCGAPWTVATYMIAGHGTPDQAPARAFARAHPESMQALTDVLVDASVAYLAAQLRAGADAVQIFDTWAGVLTGEDLTRWSIEPIARIVSGLRALVPGARVIAFPKGVGDALPRYVEETNVNAVSLDPSMSVGLGRQLQERVAIQGNLDPLVLHTGGPDLDVAIDRILEAFAGRRFVFNLGHGILPDTPVAHVARLVERVRGGNA